MRDVREFTDSQSLDLHSPGTETYEFLALPHPDVWPLQPLHEFFREEPPDDPHADVPYDVPRRCATARVPLRHVRSRHRKVAADGPPRHRPSRGQLLSHVAVASTVVIVAAVCALGGTVTQHPLRHAAVAGSRQQLAAWWPLLVYGPWTVASLSILRAAQYQRRAPHSWCTVLLFSALAVILCVDQAPRTPTSAVVASLPTLAMVCCFHQLVRQITLTRPPRRRSSGRRPGGPGDVPPPR